MADERSSSEANVTPPASDEPAVMKVGNGGDGDKKNPTGLMIGGFVLAAVLIIAGLYLAFSNGDSETAVEPTNTETTETVNTNAIPGEIALQVSDGVSPVTLAALTDSDFLAAGEWTAAADSLPADRALAGSVYVLTYEGDAPAGQAAVVIPEGVDTNMLDLHGWNGVEWVFIPSQVDAANNQLVSGETTLPQLLTVMETAAPSTAAIAAAVSGGGELPVNLYPYLTVVSTGAMVLGEDGALTGEMAEVPVGVYSQYLRTTNVTDQVDPAAVSTLLNDTAVQTNVINLLIQEATTGNYGGVHLDYRGVSRDQRDAYRAFVADLAEALAAEGLQLAITLRTPVQTANGWDTGAEDWAALGQAADAVFLQLPLDPFAYGEDGLADQMLAYAVRQIDRHKLAGMVTAAAVSRADGAYRQLPNEEALANFGALEFVEGGEEVEPGTAVEVALSGTASPLEWDGNSLTYKYSYEADDQTVDVWLGNAAALANRLAVTRQHHIGGVAIDGLGQIADDADYVAAVENYLGTAEMPQPAGAAVVWTVRDAAGGVLASGSGEELTFTWEGSEEPGAYTIDVEFALGDSTASLGSLEVAVTEPAPVVEEDAEEVAEDGDVEEVTASPSFSVGNADAVVNSNANVRTGPGLAYGIIANGATAGTQVQVIGRNDDASWFNIVLPDEQEGWIFAQLLDLNSDLDVSALEVIEVAAAAPTDGGGGGGGSAPAAAPPPVVAPVSNSGFELGGQIFGAPYGLMSYAGMTWVKRQIKWSPGTSPDVAVGMINEAKNAGFKILLSIPGQVYPTTLPDFGAYTEFLRGVASLPVPPDAIEVWNEMNIDAEWPPGQIDPSMYVNQMLAPAYNAIKGANSNIMVISGAPAPTGFFGGGCSANGCDDEPYMRGMAAAGAASYMDCIGIHYNEGIIPPNQRSGDPRTEHYTRYFWGMVDAYYNAFGGSRPLCFTELGYLTPEGYGALPGGFAWAQNTTVAQQAQWLAEAVSLSASSGKVRMFIVWNMDSTTWGSDPQAGYAIIRPGGGCPACESLRQVMGQ